MNVEQSIERLSAVIECLLACSYSTKTTALRFPDKQFEALEDEDSLCLIKHDA